MEDTSVERRLAAILAADVANYSGQMGEDEEGTLAALNDNLKEHIHPAIANRHGRLVKTTGDGILVEFASVLDATRCAIDIQEGIAKRNQELAAEDRLQFRIGVNLGDVIVQDDDIFGNGVNVAARLESLARPGGIRVSGDVYRQVQGKLPQEFEDLGEQTVKNIAEPIRVYRIVVNGEVASEKSSASTWRWNLRFAAGIAICGVILALGWFAMERLLFTPHEVSPVTAGASLTLPKEPSIAVLPFVNLGVVGEENGLGNGLAENLIATLSELPGLFVIARSSSFLYRGKAVKLQDVAKELGVRFILEGSVQISDTQARIASRLVDATNGRLMWSERFDRDVSDVFALQDEIALNIVTALQIELTEGAVARTRRRGTTNLKAWLLVSQSLESHMKYTSEANAEAGALAEKALTLDPKYPEALIRLAWMHVTNFQTGWGPDRETALAQSIELVQQALALDATYPDAYITLSNINLFLNRHEDAIAFGRKAIKLAPSHSLARASLAMTENYAGHPEEAIPLLQRAMRLSPHYPDWYLGELGRAYYLTMEYDKAVTALQRRLDRNPENGDSLILLAAAHSAAGHSGSAHKILKKFLEPRPGYTLRDYARGEFYRNVDDLNRVLESLRKAGLPE